MIPNHTDRLISLVVVSTVALVACGMTGAWLGGAGLLKPTGRVLIGGCASLLLRTEALNPTPSEIKP